jgi:hypothetical protein
VAQGRIDEALQTLAKLRLRSEHEVQDDPLLQVRFRHPPSLSAVHSSFLVPAFFAFLFFYHFLCLSPLLLSFSGRLISIHFSEPMRVSDWALSPVCTGYV